MAMHELLCERLQTFIHGRVGTCHLGKEETNLKDPYYAVAVVHDNVVGHLPQKILRICALFMKRKDLVSGGQKRSLFCGH